MNIAAGLSPKFIAFLISLISGGLPGLQLTLEKLRQIFESIFI